MQLIAEVVAYFTSSVSWSVGAAEKHNRSTVIAAEGYSDAGSCHHQPRVERLFHEIHQDQTSQNLLREMKAAVQRIDLGISSVCLNEDVMGSISGLFTSPDPDSGRKCQQDVGCRTRY